MKDRLARCKEDFNVVIYTLSYTQPQRDIITWCVCSSAVKDFGGVVDGVV